MYDILIKNGSLIDGTGAPAFSADVGITGDQVVAVGRLDGEARRTIDATGRIVSPGFIDLHTHSDFQFFVDPAADSKTTQGVTLELVGNCGISFCGPLAGMAREDLDTRLAWYDTAWKPSWTSFAGYMEALGKTRLPLNVATQVGHGTVRKAVLGMDTRAPDAGEQKRMQALVGEALDAGALGFSTGLSMAPGVYSMTPEVIGLAKEAGKRGLLYSTHARDSGDEGAGLFVAFEEALEIGRRAEVRVQFSHIKCNGSTRGKAGKMLARLEEARSEGVDVAADVYPYIAASGPMSGNVYPRWAIEGGRERALERAKDADLRAEIRAHLDDRIASIGSPDRVTVAAFPPERRYEGMTVSEVAGKMGCQPSEALVRLFERYDTQLIIAGMAQPDLEAFSAHPQVAVGSDGSSLRATGPLSAGNPHPRSYGTFPRFFAEFVRGRKLLSLEEAVRKMTALPADRLGLSRRGRLTPGSFADVVIFDPATVSDRATFPQPHKYSVGIDHVLVNGKLAVESGKPTGAAPGRVVRAASG